MYNHESGSRPTICAAYLLLRSSACLFLLLVLNAAAAGPVNEALDRIETAVDTLKSRTSGLPVVISSVKDIRNEMSPELFDELQMSLEQAKDLFGFVQDRANSAGSGSDADAADLERLIFSLENIANILAGDGTSSSRIDFGIIRSVAALAPARLLALVGRALGEAGIDAGFVERTEQAEMQIALLQEAIRQDNNEQSVAGFNEKANTLSPLPILGHTDCGFFDANRDALDNASRRVNAHASLTALVGEIVSIFSDTVAVGNVKMVGVHGYANLSIETDVLGTFGDLASAIANAEMLLSLLVSNRLQHCENLSFQEDILENQQKIIEMLKSLNNHPVQHTHRYRTGIGGEHNSVLAHTSNGDSH